MEKTIRCTVCTWRGPWEIAESAPRIRAATGDVAPLEDEAAGAVRGAEGGERGGRRDRAFPPCPDVRAPHRGR